MKTETKTDQNIPQRRDFVTFFDSNYLPKALVTVDSLSRHHPNFRIHAACFDELSYSVVKDLANPHFIPLPLNEFEPEELKATKHLKKKQYEYYWAFKPHIIQTVMDRTQAEMVTYMDCDFRFFSSPEVIFEEMGDADVLIQPNNFSFPEVDQFKPVGYYCSCFESFRNTANGRKVLEWWHQQNVDWCFATFDRNRFADQKYLDGWKEKFVGVREIALPGANVAPWNVQKYTVSEKEGKVLLNDKYPLIYYHYHSFRMNIGDYSYIITGDRENLYDIEDSVVETVYRPYIDELREATQNLKKHPGYLKYTQSNPQSNVHLINSEDIQTSFSSFRDHL